MKNLSDMTLEELWELFPIFLTEHDPCWAKYYEEEAAAIKNMLPFPARLYHIGSTAVDGIMAKPIVDILATVDSREQMRAAASLLQNHGYIVMSTSEDRISLNKGYTVDGFAERVFHLHIRLGNDIDEVYFRDYISAHADVAKEYEKLKLGLAVRYKHDRDAYTEAKTEFIKKYTELSKKEGARS